MGAATGRQQRIPVRLQMINLEAWLLELLGQREEIPESCYEWAELHWMNLTHFTCLDNLCLEVNQLSRVALVEAWTRQMALFGDTRV